MSERGPGRLTTEEQKKRDEDASLELLASVLNEFTGLKGGDLRGYVFKMNRLTHHDDVYWKRRVDWVAQHGFGPPTRAGSKTAEWDFGVPGQVAKVKWLDGSKKEEGSAGGYRPWEGRGD